MPDSLELRRNDKALNAREGQRVADVVMGLADGRTHVCHYLMIETPDSSRAVNPVAFEPYRDVERAIAVARQCETNGRPAKCRGGFTLTYRDGQIVGAKALKLGRKVMPVTPRRSSNILAEARP